MYNWNGKRLFMPTYIKMETIYLFVLFFFSSVFLSLIFFFLYFILFHCIIIEARWRYNRLCQFISFLMENFRIIELYTKKIVIIFTCHIQFFFCLSLCKVAGDWLSSLQKFIDMKWKCLNTFGFDPNIVNVF